jgi:hypothetical protein
MKLANAIAETNARNFRELRRLKFEARILRAILTAPEKKEIRFRPLPICHGTSSKRL